MAKLQEQYITIENKIPLSGGTGTAPQPAEQTPMPPPLPASPKAGVPPPLPATFGSGEKRGGSLPPINAGAAGRGEEGRDKGGSAEAAAGTGAGSGTIKAKEVAMPVRGP